MSKIADHMFLNVVDTRFGQEKASKQTILFRCGSFKPTILHNDGFIYCWALDDINISGGGVVINSAYVGKSEEEVCLLCEIENPVTREDVQTYIDSYGPYMSQSYKDKIMNFFEETNR